MPLARALFGPAFLAPMGLWASNAGRFVDVPVVLVAASLVLGVAVIVTKLARARHVGHLVGAQAATIVFWSWTAVPVGWFASGGWDLGAGVAVIAVAASMGSQLRSFEWLPMVFGTVLGVAALSMAVTGWLGDRSTVDSSDVAAPGPLVVAQPGTDILILVVDGYTSPSNLERDFSYEMADTAAVLEGAGFSVLPATLSNYSFTIHSVPSLLQLGYLPPREGNLLIGPSPGNERSSVAGETGLMVWLADIGYHITKFESGWEDDRCGRVDVCIDAPRVGGLTAWVLWRRTPFRVVADDLLVHPYPVTALSVLDQLPAIVAEAASNGRPDFIMAHVVSPHAPYALTADCDIRERFENVFISGALGSGFDGPDGEEREGYLSQVDCINTHLVALAENPSSAGMSVLITGDHGSDIRGQAVI